MHTPARRLAPLLIAASLTALVGACGSSDADSQAALEQRIERERDEAARLARQDEKIKQLEKEVREAKKSGGGTSSSNASSSRTPASAAGTTSNASASADDWSGGSGHTVVIASLGSQSQALAKQRDVTTAGLDAGVLNSSDYSSLRPGFWVVFSGSFSTAELAAERQARARNLGFGDAYVRYVSR